MFTKSEISTIDSQYFRVLGTSAFACSLQSMCTGHYWQIYSKETRVGAKHFVTCELYHRHDNRSEYHFQQRVPSLKEAIQVIQDHDAYVLREHKV